MERNYLKGVVGDAVNLMLSAAAFNFKRAMNDLLDFILSLPEWANRWILCIKFNAYSTQTELIGAF